MTTHPSDEVDYQRLAKDDYNQSSFGPLNGDASIFKKPHHRYRLFTLSLVILFSVGIGFSGGATWMRHVSSKNDFSSSSAPKIPIPHTQSVFAYNSPFSQEPPQGDAFEEGAEPIWDALVPNGLGYFRDGVLAPKVSIPTTFHQLHCLYVLRRAYYSNKSDKELESFDLGKNRTIHAAHCFDYLKQTITCSVDSTVEPYEADPKIDGFLGSGFPRQCRSFEVLKQYVEDWRVFNATGFLAAGVIHGMAHINGDG